jgi:4-amino-4-deoxy-L-arabinose transferase-like glycosyltransferase
MSFIGSPPLPRRPCYATPAFGFALITLITAISFTWRLMSSMDLLAYAQDVPAMYVLDAVVNGHWLCQHDALGSITSKPPMFTWLAGGLSVIAGRVTWLTLCLPSGLATLGTVCVVLIMGRRWWGWQTGLWAAVVYLLSPMTGKQVALVRTDPLFTFTVALTAFAAWTAWERGRGWTWFWLAAAVATLTKGPAGVALGAAGLGAVVWERRSGQPAALRGSHLWGLALYLVLTVGWFALAVTSEGRAVADKMLVRELLGHATGTRSDEPFLVNSYKPTLYLLARFAPWSLLTCLGVWRAVWRPTSALGERRFERFVWCWLVLSLLLFTLAPHVRPELEMPLVAPAALLAGRELYRLTSRWRRRAVVACAVAVVGVGAVMVVGAHTLALQEVPSTKQARGLEAMATSLKSQVGDGFPFTYVDRTFGLQFFLGTMRQAVAPEQVARLLSEPTPAYVVVRKRDRLLARLGSLPTDLHALARWPSEGEAYITIISNHPKLEWTEQMAFGVGPLTVHTDKLRLKVAHNDGFWFSAESNDGRARVTNESQSSRRLFVRVTGPGFDSRSDRTLATGETWTVSAPFEN